MSYIAPNLNKNKHRFFGRNGGVSGGKYSSLNINIPSADKPENISKNLEIIANHLNANKENLFIMHQGVSNHVVYADKPELRQTKADGCVTKNKNLLLCVCTADCAPVLFADEKNEIIGVAHAGWRGALHGVIENTINLMLKNGAKIENIKTAIGPCLQQESFDCREDMYNEFLEKDKNFKKFFTPKNNEQYLFDAEKFVLEKLKSLNLNDISTSGINTYTCEDEFFSYRRDTHRNQNQDIAAHISVIRI